MNKKKFVKKARKKKEVKKETKEKVIYSKPPLKTRMGKLKKVFVPELFIIPFLIVNIVLAGACIILANIISQQQDIKKLTITQEPIEVPQLSTDVPLQISARSYIIYEPESRKVVDGKNEYLQFAPASSTKLMTALVALDYYSPEQVIVARGVSRVQGSKMGLIEGEAMAVKDILYGLMLPSGNDAAFVLAQNYPGGQAAFVKAMNEKAQNLHLLNTVFVDPSGLQNENFTTAYDLARLAAVAIQNELLAQIVRTQSIEVFNTARTSSYSLTNLNELLFDPQVFGIKTGFTDEAGGVLVTGYMYEDKKYIVVVLKSLDRFYDTQQILYGIIPQIELVRYSYSRSGM